MAHLEFWRALRAKLLFLKIWRGGSLVGLVGLRRWPLRRTEGIGRKTWWESWVLAICVGSNVWHWFVGNLVFWV